MTRALGAVGAQPWPESDLAQARLEQRGALWHLVLFLFADRAGEVVATPFHVALAPGGVVSWSEAWPPFLDEVFARLRGMRERVARRSEVVYHLVAGVLHDAWRFLDGIGDRIADLERAGLDPTGSSGFQRRLLAERRRVLRTRHLLASMRDAIHHLTGAVALEGPEVVWYLELYDVVLRLFDTVDTYRELLDSIVDVHLASVSNRLNEIVKSLTLVTTLMVPGSVVASLYGMNFDHMPGSRHPYGFYLVVGSAMVVSALLWWWFRRRRWI
ncbi:MAG: hypothetical protein K6U14_03975 [Firmicutes bacterium]|nr:hypothetical protein [Alicyclobacillaceae bacterium]MCL6496778.1 hypothetical protein [Bacillota bacterium]